MDEIKGNLSLARIPASAALGLKASSRGELDRIGGTMKCQLMPLLNHICQPTRDNLYMTLHHMLSCTLHQTQSMFKHGSFISVFQISYIPSSVANSDRVTMQWKRLLGNVVCLPVRATILAERSETRSESLITYSWQKWQRHCRPTLEI